MAIFVSPYDRVAPWVTSVTEVSGSASQPVSAPSSAAAGVTEEPGAPAPLSPPLEPLAAHAPAFDAAPVEASWTHRGDYTDIGAFGDASTFCLVDGDVSYIGDF
ncbi:MAG: hypothetical protein AAF360_07210 [Pseudomonadota bacterium]